MATREFIVPADGLLRRLDVFLRQALPDTSRQRVQSLIASDGVRVNGRRRPKGALVQAGDVVGVDEPTQAVALVARPDLAVVVLYEDTDVVVVDKPAGMPTHALQLAERDTLANFLVARFPELRNVGWDPREPGLVHRLDTDTSGVVLVARTLTAYRALRRQFADRAVIKEYLAVVGGDVGEPGEIRAPIAHDRRNARRMRVCVTADEATARRARPAITRFRPIERFGVGTLLGVEIPTGVMHQIRAHLAFTGHPIVGDELYGGRGAPRQLLHAQAITFTHPDGGARVRIESPIPIDLQAYLTGLRSAGDRRRRR